MLRRRAPVIEGGRNRSRPKTEGNRPQPKHRRLRIDRLEERVLLSLPAAEPSTLFLMGTPGDDVFECVAGPTPESWLVEVNGIKHDVGPGITTIHFDGRSGTDTATLTGSQTDESAEIWPDHGTFTSAGVTFTLTDVDSINIDAGTGEDTVIVHDSAGDDELFARAATAAQPVSSITVTDFDYYDSEYVSTYAHLLNDFEILTAQSTAGIDISSFFDSDGDDHLVAEQFKTELSGPGFDFVAENFQFTHAYAKAGGDDLAEMYDTPKNDRFKAGPDLRQNVQGCLPAAGQVLRDGRGLRHRRHRRRPALRLQGDRPVHRHPHRVSAL